MVRIWIWTFNICNVFKFGYSKSDFWYVYGISVSGWSVANCEIRRHVRWSGPPRPHVLPITRLLPLVTRDENGSDTDGYHRYYICFHISVRIQIRIRIVSTMSDRIRLDIDIINMRFEYLDTNTVSDVEYLDLDVDTSKPLYTDSVSNMIRKYPYRFHP